jgi:hypothetical protein
MEIERAERSPVVSRQRHCNVKCWNAGALCLGLGNGGWGLCLFEVLRNTPDSETLHKVRGISNLMEHAQPYMQESALKSEQGDARRETGDGTSRRLLNFFCSVLPPTFSMFSTL